MRIIRGTVFGAIAFFLLGWLIYGVLLMDFFSVNMNQCVNRTGGEIIWWALVLANLITALLLTLILRWSDAKEGKDGLQIGAIFGVLISLSIDLSYWSMTTMFNDFISLLVDVVATTLILALTGMLITVLWGRSR
jgi:hypothetical protein